MTCGSSQHVVMSIVKPRHHDLFGIFIAPIYIEVALQPVICTATEPLAYYFWADRGKFWSKPRLMEDCPCQVRAIATPEIGRRPRDAFRPQTQDFT